MQIVVLAVSFFYVLGIISAVHAVMCARTSQGAIAWALSLITFPVLSVPAYWVFGRRKFEGYILARKASADVTEQIPGDLKEAMTPYISDYGDTHPETRAAERLARVALMKGNYCELLIDGQATFESIFSGIDEAEDYVLVQFYIVHDDGLGRELKTRLIAKANQGVRVYFLYDELGSLGLPAAYIDELKQADVQVSPFNTRKGKRNRFQLNFRNHRKVVVVDGKTAWIGGHNVGDEYLGKDPKIGRWRDTHVKITGPAALAAQVSFMEDYQWAMNELLELTWTPTASTHGDIPVLIVPTGPADDSETALLMFVHIINSARRRIWISSPYFVPDESVMSALKLARLKGVDVRIIIPEMPDNKLMYFAAYDYFDDLSECGIEFYRYQDGFTHEKVMLVDDALSAIGTANFDNRSFRLNFEITALIGDKNFASQVEEMFEDGFDSSRQMQGADYDSKPFWFKFAVRVSRLMSPVL
ncbi:MAG TPA: cardiolipin synthase [Gammaproteobacteria bacterium]|nr:cardiolipin synthase [Gammaproteobacteria bacterium]